MEARKTDDRYVMKQEWDQQYHEYLLAQEPILLGGTKDSTHQDSTEHASQKKNTFFSSQLNKTHWSCVSSL